MGLLTLSSVVLALVFYIPEIEVSTDQMYVIYIFDLFVVGILVFDFTVRAQHSKQATRYTVRHSYEIPAMIPLIVFALFEDPLFLGAAVRSIRFVRLFRLIRLFRLANLFRTAQHWKLSSFLYLLIILTASVTFGAIAILSVEEGNENIANFEDAVWFSVTTLTISGFGDVYPTTTYGRIIAAILSFIGIGIILGFISNIGSGLVSSRLGKSHKKLHDETKDFILNKMRSIEELHEDELAELISLINNLHKERKVNLSLRKCSKCRNNFPADSIYCNKCGHKV